MGQSNAVTLANEAVCCDVQDEGKAAQKLMQPGPQSVDALKIVEEARHKAGGAALAHHKKH